MINKKVRIAISADLSASILFASNKTCCICRDPGKPVQIHHIDENPSNNTPDNLSVLCLICHNDTQVRGGFGKQLTEPVVRQYRDDWLARVKARRDAADELAVSMMSGNNHTYRAPKYYEHFSSRTPSSRDGLYDYLDSLPLVKQALVTTSQEGWGTGSTASMIEANEAYIAGLQGILIGLLDYYENECFESQSPHEFLGDVISARYRWHRLRLEPAGPNTGGTIVRPVLGCAVASDLENMVVDMVVALIGYDDTYNYYAWIDEWLGQERPESSGVNGP
ncbi:HNH endonuclease signature motif containing protein [Pantoea vagans]|jgi:hypothetical protein|uniref:HNH endonuclease signature motif containing protein n=1 Tax=Pantoea vagans TaxID=470934 RepID=UPI0011810AD8|nr:HNH endonuclease signature motif containing protein [Pantoea vagans]